MVEHLSDNFENLLDAECGLHWEWEYLAGASVLGGLLHICESCLQEPHQVLMMMSQEKCPHVSGKNRETILK